MGGGRGESGGGQQGGWVAIYFKSNYVPETRSFSKIYLERSFSSCKFFLDGRTDRQRTDRRMDTDRQTYL